MRVIYFNARGSRHILGGDFRLFQSGSHLSFLRHIYIDGHAKVRGAVSKVYTLPL